MQGPPSVEAPPDDAPVTGSSCAGAVGRGVPAQAPRFFLAEGSKPSSVSIWTSEKMGGKSPPQKMGGGLASKP
eukprot:2327260-Amphidinium_carterae.1